MKKILITGANGQLGRELQALTAEFPAYALLPATREQLDLSRTAHIDRFLAEESPDCIINCAAYTAVDKAESEPEPAQRVNADGPAHLARACAAAEIPLVHFSTDYVYHTGQNTPYRETDPTHPRGVYARTKLAGETAVLEAHPAAAVVIRTSWVYSSFGKNFLKTMLRLAAERDSLRVVYDQVGAPTYARDLARTVMQIIARAEKKGNWRELAGVYNYCNEGVCSWYDFAVAIFELSNTPCKVDAIESKDFPTAAPRPPYSVLNKSKIRDTFGLDIPHWRDGLTRCLRALREAVRV